MVPLNTFNVVAATFLHTLDYRDLLYVHVVRLLLRFCICLTQLTMPLTFTTNFKHITHRCELYARAGWSGLATHRRTHVYIFTYRVILVLLSSYLCTYVSHSTRSRDFYMLFVPNLYVQFL